MLRAGEHAAGRGLPPELIEKDYYVTEVLRLISAAGGEQVLLKGGTSLSKGWDLIQRFSEDVDLFLDPEAYAPPLGWNGRNRELKKLRDAIGQHPAFVLVAGESETTGGFGRNDHFAYSPRFRGIAGVAARVRVEAGTASGRQPTTVRELRSYVGQFLQETSQSLGAEDEGPFPMRLLHFRRTFVEKLFAIHSKVELLRRDGRPVGSYARHYYVLLSRGHVLRAQ